jgi:hypothetical protein
MERGIYIGKVQEEPFGVPFDYCKGDLYLMNRFLCYLIQNQDAISESLTEQFSSEKPDLFLSIINQYDEFEFLYFHNFDRIEVGDVNFKNLDFQIGKDCIILKHIDTELIFPLPINETVEHDFICDDKEINFGKIEEYIGKKVNLSYNEDFPPIFMSEIQIQTNLAYLTNIIDELLLALDINSNSNKNELASIFDNDF